MTAIRQATLDVIGDSPTPLSAAMIAKNIPISCDMASVYRALHYLEKKDHLHSFILHCPEHGTERYYTIRGSSSHHHHWFHCLKCHTFINLGDCPVASILPQYEKKFGLEVTDHNLYVSGLCSSCKNKH